MRYRDKMPRNVMDYLKSHYLEVIVTSGRVNAVAKRKLINDVEVNELRFMVFDSRANRLESFYGGFLLRAEDYQKIAEMIKRSYFSRMGARGARVRASNAPNAGSDSFRAWFIENLDKFLETDIEKTIALCERANGSGVSKKPGEDFFIYSKKGVKAIPLINGEMFNLGSKFCIEGNLDSRVSNGKFIRINLRSWVSPDIYESKEGTRRVYEELGTHMYLECLELIRKSGIYEARLDANFDNQRGFFQRMLGNPSNSKINTFETCRTPQSEGAYELGECEERKS